ncbi:hypothetical protein HCJ76_00365 [Streptomyces sp. MC1]|nr:hypothetical protein [Streptomyces sp. MC1]MBG7696596.1 hypothetical protein [Streptomyces sp. MC1]
MQCHEWWARCQEQGIDGPTMVAARQALKHAEGAVPLRQDEVVQTA